MNHACGFTRFDEINDSTFYITRRNFCTFHLLPSTCSFFLFFFFFSSSQLLNQLDEIEKNIMLLLPFSYSEFFAPMHIFLSPSSEVTVVSWLRAFYIFILLSLFHSPLHMTEENTSTSQIWCSSHCLASNAFSFLLLLLLFFLVYLTLSPSAFSFLLFIIQHQNSLFASVPGSLALRICFFFFFSLSSALSLLPPHEKQTIECLRITN